jgi:hypothetical protein
MYNNRRQGIDFVQTYFALRLFGLAFHVFAIIIAALTVAGLFILQMIEPDWVEPAVLGLFALFPLSIVALIVHVIVQAVRFMFARSRAVQMHNMGYAPPHLSFDQVVPGSIPNPPYGVSWFDGEGNRLRYDRATGEWRYENTDAPSSVMAAASASPMRGLRATPGDRIRRV